MKRLSECNKNALVKVVKIHTSGSLKQRLISLGIMKDVTLRVLAHTAAKGTLEIKVGKMQIALRSEEAKLIEVTDVA
ncbi:MAG: ferrous iron transport protein A [Sulfurimonas sp.]|nr:MAG: ferrous iron transport protein A [Sulfurimonas sp.]